MEGQSNGPDITRETEINASLSLGARNYRGTEGRVYRKEHFHDLADDESVPAQLRVVDGTINADGVFTNVVLTQERRSGKGIVGREVSRAMQNIPRNQLIVENGSAEKVIGKSSEVQETYKACRNRIIKDLMATGTAIVPQERLSQVVIRALNLDIQTSSAGRNNLSYKAETRNEIPVYVIKCDVKEAISDKLILPTGETGELKSADDTKISSDGTGAVIPPNEGITGRIAEARNRLIGSLEIKRRERPTES